MPHDIIELARFPSAFEAAMARNRLADADICSHLDGEAMASCCWYLGSAIGGVKLFIDRQDAERATVILSSAPAVDLPSFVSEEESPEDTEDHENDVSSELIRAFRASMIGVCFFPPLLNLYSVFLLVRHRLFRSPRNWRLGVTVATNLVVFSFVLSILMIILTPPSQDPFEPRSYLSIYGVRIGRESPDDAPSEAEPPDGGQGEAGQIKYTVVEPIWEERVR